MSSSKIRIGVIDSGLDTENPELMKFLRKGISVNNDGSSDPEFLDKIGHGTACADLITRPFNAEQIELFAYKIFDNAENTDVIKFKYAIEHAMSDNIDILNCSLGTIDPDAQYELESVIENAADNGMIIVCAWNDEDITTWPANFKNVISVKGGNQTSQTEWGWEKNKRDHVLFRGTKQRTKWKNGQQIFIGGSSFATALCTRLIAEQLVNQTLLKNTEKVKSFLESNASFRNEIDNTQSNVIEWNTVHRKIKKAGLYPFFKESHSFIRYHDKLDFELSWVADFKRSKYAGKQTNEFIQNTTRSYSIHSGLPENKGDIDSLIVGYVDKASEAQKKDFLTEALEYAFKNQLSVFSYLAPDDELKWVERFHSVGLWLEIPKITYEKAIEILQTVPEKKAFDTPIIGVFGTSAKQGKFTLQLALRYELKKRGFRVGQIGTEHQSGCFGIDFTFPSGYGMQQSLQIPMDFHIPLLRRVISEMDKGQFDVIIGGAQSGLLSPDPYEYSHLPSLFFLSALLPDYVVLIHNSNDDVNFVSRCENMIKSVVGHSNIFFISFEQLKDQNYTSIEKMVNQFTGN